MLLSLLKAAFPAPDRARDFRSHGSILTDGLNDCPHTKAHLPSCRPGCYRGGTGLFRAHDSLARALNLVHILRTSFWPAPDRAVEHLGCGSSVGGQIKHLWFCLGLRDDQHLAGPQELSVLILTAFSIPGLGQSSL